MTKAYECAICLGVNHSKHARCQFCGAVPAVYSPISKPAILNRNDQWIEVVAAYGASHVEHSHTRRLYFRTVPADYFA